MYKVEERIAIGGLGDVYAATSPTGGPVALKKQHVTKRIAHPMLLHEACALHLLAGHPAIPAVVAWGRTQFYEYLAMQRLGLSVEEFAPKDGCMDGPTAARLAEQMLDAIAHTHSRHIVHCDIKPGNFVFGTGPDSARVYLIDFGFASYFRDPASLAHRPLETDQHFRGTPFYASLNVHRRLMLESLAYTLLHLVQGVLPWEATRRRTTIHREKEAWTGAELAAGAPALFGAFLDYARGLGYDEDPDYARWQRAFAALAADAPIPSAAPRTFPPRAAPRSTDARSSASEDPGAPSASSDDNWTPVGCTAPAPQGVPPHSVFGDERALLRRAGVKLMTQVPVMREREIYNKNEAMVEQPGSET
ncbi:kinase-like domain-containing protein [Mycena latifolia]|nr:kinase-like domain-containing protein [Mycena latifolia]